MRYGFAAALLAAGCQTVWADADGAPAQDLEGRSVTLAAAAGEVQSVTVQGSRIEETPSRSATGLALTRRETPQSLSEVSREQIDAFALDTMNDVLDISTGISVERVETDRTYYFARGMPVQSFQVDGIGLPVNWDVVVGDLDTTIYERVEIIRGADGLLTGIGNPSATINHVRKRPTREFQGSFEITGGSWDKRRVDADISGTGRASSTSICRRLSPRRAGVTRRASRANGSTRNCSVRSRCSDRSRTTLRNPPDIFRIWVSSTSGAWISTFVALKPK